MTEVLVRKFLIVLLLAVAAIAAPAAADPDPFPAGACVRSTMISRQPVCVVIDPNS